MNGINLIPAHRLAARRRAARVRLWFCIGPVCVSLLAGSYAWLLGTWETRTGDVKEKMGALNARIAESERLASQTRSATREIQAALAAARTVADQPDWGSLLSVLATRLGEDAVLSSCALEPAETAAVSSAPQNGPPALKGQPLTVAARPNRYRLTLTGLARTQEAVSRLTLEYANAHLFDSVNLVETRRSTFLDQPSVAFRIECAITDVPAGRSP